MQKNKYVQIDSKTNYNDIIDNLGKNENFMIKIQQLCRKVNQESKTYDNSCRYEFASQSYPWSQIEQQNNKISGQIYIQEISNLLFNMVQNTLHNVMNKQFIKITNQVLTMRQQISLFTTEQIQINQKYKNDFNKNIQAINRKIMIQNSSNLQQQQQNNRSTFGKIMRSSYGMSNNRTNNGIIEQQQKNDIIEKKTIYHDIYKIKQQIQNIKKIPQEIKNINITINILSEKIDDFIMQMKIENQQKKQQFRRNVEHLQMKINQLNTKQIIVNQVKKRIKSYFKVYTEQISLLKENTQKSQQKSSLVQHNLQNYIGSQLKSVWLLLNSHKRKLQHIQNCIDIGNQSFLMD